MKLDGLLKPLTEGRRFFLVSYLPTCAALVYLLVIVWAGGWGWGARTISFKAAWQTATGLGVGEVVAIVLAVTVLAVLLQPFQGRAAAERERVDRTGRSARGRGR
jgi:hypothetical protein